MRIPLAGQRSHWTSDGVLKTLLVKLKGSPGEIKSFGFKIKKAVYQPGLADKLPFDVE